MPKIVDKKLMQEKIMKASIDAFLKYGVNNSTMEIIAKKAKIAKGTLYLYFASKQDLISEINVQHYTKLKAFLISEKPFETLHELLAHIKTNLLTKRKDAEFIKIFFEAFGSQLSSKNFTNEYNIFFEEIALFYKQNFELLLQNNQIDQTINTFTLSRALVSMMDGLIMHRGFFNIPDEKYIGMVEDALQMFELGLSKK